MFGSLFLLGQVWVYWGVLPGVAVMVGLSHLGFLMSRYLNRLADSSQRATVLSVKGLFFNIGYGTVSLVFARAVSWQRREAEMNDNEALIWTLEGQPWVFVALFLVFLAVARVLRLPREIKERGER